MVAAERLLKGMRIRVESSFIIITSVEITLRKPACTDSSIADPLCVLVSDVSYAYASYHSMYSYITNIFWTFDPHLRLTALRRGTSGSAQGALDTTPPSSEFPHALITKQHVFPR